MSIHIAPVVLHVRGFNAPVDVERPVYAMSEAYDFTMVVLINDAGIARLMGLDGRISHRNRRQLALKLKAYGVRRVEWRHHGTNKYLQLVKDDEL
jgi:hypothetical protein